MTKGQTLLLRILEAAYYYFVDYDTDQAIRKAERDLLKLKERILKGDLSATKLAWNQLEELDKLTSK